MSIATIDFRILNILRSCLFKFQGIYMHLVTVVQIRIIILVFVVRRFLLLFVINAFEQEFGILIAILCLRDTQQAILTD